MPSSARTRRRRVCLAKALWRCRLVCLRRGTFHRRKVPKMRRGLRPPVPRGAPRRASQEKASRKPLRSTGPSRPILPAPSRLRAGQYNRTIVTATEVFTKAARTAPEQGFDFARGSVTTPQSRLCRDSSPYTGEPWRVQTGGFTHDFPIFSVEAAISRPYGAPAANVPIRIFAVDIAHCASERLRDQRASVERIRNRFPRRGRCLHRPEPAAGGSVRRKRSGTAGLSASGGELFTAEKFPKRAGGLRPPVPRGAPRRASQEAASRKPLRSTGPSRPILPAPSRLRAGQYNRTIVTATEVFTKAARTAPEQGFDFARGSVTTPQSRLCRDSSPYTGEPWRVQTGSFTHDFPIFAVGARLARMLGPMPRNAA